MARNKVLEKAKVSIPSGRSAFDMSQERSFTSLCGCIDVPYCQPFVAGTKGTINRVNFTRTAQVISPAFHRVTEHYDFFIVPLHSLWSQWENWKLNLNDLKNTAVVPWDSTNNIPDLALPLNSPRMNYLYLGDRLGYNPSQVSVATFANKFNHLIKLCDSLRLGAQVVCQSLPSQPQNFVESLFMPAAFQKCYFEHYRNTVYEANNPYAYNLDWLYDGVHNGLLNPNCPSGTPQTQDDFVARELFAPRYVNYRNDAFHNIYPALNYISPSAGQPVGLWRLPSTVGGLGNQGVSNGQAYLSSAMNGQISPSINSGLNTVSQQMSVSVQQIRAIFALDKLMRAAAYAPKHVREQFKAQYGVDGVEDFDMISERIGSFQSTVQFQEVTNMTESVNVRLGALGAKGLGGSDRDKPIHFYCKYDSIVICMHYFLPRARYDSYGIHPWNTKIAREDFYIKAFENLGLRPFYRYNLQAAVSSNFTQQIGWTVPNSEYKILPDLNFGAFKESFEEVTFEPSSGGSPAQQRVDIQAQGELSTFVPHTLSVFQNSSGSSVNADYFKCRPEDLDSLFVVNVPADHRLSYYQFFTDVRIVCSIVAPMSVHGQPSL